MNQKGFATLEVILMVVVIGILASIAVPRFDSVTTAANTAKIQADLSTIDTAIAVFSLENPSSNPTWESLSPYLKDAENIKPPKGKCYIKGTSTDVPADKYDVTEIGINSDVNSPKEYRATLGNHPAGDFTNNKDDNTGSN